MRPAFVVTFIAVIMSCASEGGSGDGGACPLVCDAHQVCEIADTGLECVRTRIPR